MRFNVVTLFPDMFPGYLSQSLLNKAIERGLIEVQIHDLRDWADNKHNRVDDRPFGGGPGMVIMVEPVVKCVESILDRQPDARTILLTPQGQRLDQRKVEELSGHDSFIFLCGRYEGFDQRVVDILQPEEISVGDYVLNGGEVASMVMMDALLRMVPGVLGDEESSIQDSFSSGNRMLEFAQYTRPREFRGYQVPEILLSGDHERIRLWRQQETLKRTRERRSDLLEDGNPEVD